MQRPGRQLGGGYPPSPHRSCIFYSFLLKTSNKTPKPRDSARLFILALQQNSDAILLGWEPAVRNSPLSENGTLRTPMESFQVGGNLLQEVEGAANFSSKLTAGSASRSERIQAIRMPRGCRIAFHSELASDETD